jgi:hypothetical protein
MSGWWNKRSRVTRLLLYAAAATLAFGMAVSVGAVAALMVRGNLSFPAGESARPEEPSPAGEQGESGQRQQADADRPQQEKASAKREQAAPQDNQTTYVREIDEIQANAVETFLDSHEKLLRYDSLTSGDIEEMQANQVTLQGLSEKASGLDAPQKYKEQKVVFLSAIDKLHQAAQLAYALSADPISATHADFEDYDSYVDEAGADLQQSNEILGKDYETIEGVRSISNTS